MWNDPFQWIFCHHFLSFSDVQTNWTTTTTKNKWNKKFIKQTEKRKKIVHSFDEWMKESWTLITLFKKTINWRRKYRSIWKSSSLTRWHCQSSLDFVIEQKISIKKWIKIHFFPDWIVIHWILKSSTNHVQNSMIWKNRPYHRMQQQQHFFRIQQKWWNSYSMNV